jgi:catechol 2,3-dioxygenase-like lactoylglutathione lyase family enzyme
MPLLRMEHYLVLSDDIDETKRFYCDALGLSQGFRPNLEFPGYWLYLGDTACIHIAEWRSYAVWTKEAGIPVSKKSAGTGPVDHIAFNASGFAAMRTQLRERGYAPSENLLDEIGLRQLFLHDPNGVAIELNFRD